MKRVVAITLLLLAPLFAQAAQEEVIEGIHYQLVMPPQPTATATGQVEVVELFWYGCPHCYHLEPSVQNWLERKPENVVFIRIPAFFRDNIWKLHATAYYAGEALGVAEKMHEPFFDAIHKHNRKLASEEELTAFYADHGVDPEAFRKAFRSFAVQVKVNRAGDLSRRYGITGVPSLIVDGKYRTSTTLAMNDRISANERVMQIVNHLVASSAAEPKEAVAAQ